mmetsp:Transcript_139176/g.433055  ORF Transcript_139176/g.433055 Transcript_139176/m.433055 type:complete len:583 (-) Transcript_139176:415-2163(-)
MAPAVIQVDAPACRRAEYDHCVGVTDHRSRASARAELLHDDVTAAHEDGHVSRARLEGDGLAARPGGGRLVPVVEPPPGREVHAHRVRVRPRDRANQHGLSHEELLVCVRVGRLVRQVMVPDRSQNWQTAQRPLSEERVPHGQELVAREDRFPYHASGLGAEHPGLPALRREVGVGAVEGVPDPELVPPKEKVKWRIPHKTAHVGSGEGEAAEGERQEHRHGAGQVLPLGHVVPRPDGAVAVRADEEGPRQHEGPHLGRPRQLALHAGLVVEEAVGVVDVPVLDVKAVRVAPVKVIARHRDLGSIEDAGLVHVVPGVQLWPAVGVDAGVEQPRPDLPGGGVAEVGVVRGPRPAKALVLGAVAAPDEDVRLLEPGEDRVVVVTLDVGVDDGHHLPVALGQRVQHPPGVREVLRVPREVALRVGVLQIQPQDVVGNPGVVEALVHLKNVLHIHVVPTGLVLAKCRKRWKSRPTGHSIVLLQDRLRRWSGKGEHVQHARLEEPPRRRAAVGALRAGSLDLDEALGGVHDHESGGCRTLARGPSMHGGDKGDVAVDRHGHVHLVLEDVQVVQPVGLLEAGRREVQP